MRFIKVKKTGESWQQPAEFGTAWTDDELNHWYADWAEVSDPPHNLEYPFYDGDKWVEHNAVSSEERIHRLSVKNSSDWKEHDNLFTQWQKAEKLGWTVATKRKKAFDEHTKKVTADWHALQDLKKGLDYD